MDRLKMPLPPSRPHPSSQTFICNKLKSYLSWLGHDTKHINVGSYRRLQKPAGQLQSADLFDSNNPVRGGWPRGAGGRGAGSSSQRPS